MSAGKDSAVTTSAETRIDTAALEIVDANLTLGDGEQTVTALDGVSLTVRPGEMVAVVGRRAPASRACWPSPAHSPLPTRAPSVWAATTC